MWERGASKQLAPGAPYTHLLSALSAQKQGDHMRKHNFLSSLVIFVAGFLLSVIIDGRRLAFLGQGTLSNPAVAEVAAQTPQKPSTLQKWEYRVVTKFVANHQADIDFELNRLGEQGYELCGVTQNANFLTVALRRPRQ
jgi:hypothetical protein